MSRPVPFCRAFVAADIVSGGDDLMRLDGLLCIGSRCSMWHERRDSTPATNLGCCAENLTAVPWVDPAAKETP